MKPGQRFDLIIADVELLEAIITEYVNETFAWAAVGRHMYAELPARIRAVLPESSWFHGEPTRNDVLTRAGVDRAWNVLIAMDQDSENMFILVTVRSLQPKARCIVKIRNHEATGKFKAAGAEQVIPSGTVIGRILSRAATNTLEHQFIMGMQTRFLESHLKEDTVRENELGCFVREQYPHAVTVWRNGNFIYEMDTLRIERGDVVLSVLAQPEINVTNKKPE